jgi:hypothetical protein
MLISECSKFFPPAGEDENKQSKDDTEMVNQDNKTVSDLPDVPTMVPGEHDQPDAKKQKTEHEEEGKI